MANTVLLDNVEHHDLKVDTRYSADYGDNINEVIAFPTELAELQREYPLFLYKDAKEGYKLVALLGFDKGENLFLDENGWNARYVPAAQARGPFIIGFQKKEIDGELVNDPVIHVDLDSPRVGGENGEPVFKPHGGNSPYLENISHILKVIHTGIGVMKPMFETFERHELIEPVSIDVNLNDREKYQIPDHYTISEEKLAALSGTALEELHKNGYLRAAYLILASLPNMNRLIAMKNRKNAG